MEKRENAAIALSIFLGAIFVIAFAYSHVGEKEVAFSPESCEDSDGGTDYFANGKICSGGNCAVDYCNDDVLTEYYCGFSDGKLKSVNYECENGCSAGKCALE